MGFRTVHSIVCAVGVVKLAFLGSYLEQLIVSFLVIKVAILSS